MTLGEAMVQYRAKNNLTQPELAKLCKMSTMSISILERGLRNPSRLTRAKIENLIYGDRKENNDGNYI